MIDHHHVEFLAIVNGHYTANKCFCPSSATIYDDRNLAIMFFLRCVLASVPLRWWITVAVIPPFPLQQSTCELLEMKRRSLGAPDARKGTALARKCETYGRSVHERFPTGAVVVSESDLAAQLRKQPDSVVTASNLLLKE